MNLNLLHKTPKNQMNKINEVEYWLNIKVKTTGFLEGKIKNNLQVFEEDNDFLNILQNTKHKKK